MSIVKSPEQRQFIVTCGERGYIELLEVFEAQSLVGSQLIRTPTSSLWSIRTLPNGDLAVASDNGIIYIFTTSSDRFAPEAAQEVFAADVASKVAIEEEMRASQETETVTIKVSLDDGAPNMELKYVKGSNPADAAENFIRENNLPYSYLNEITEYIKTNVPEARNYGSYQPARTSNIQQAGVSYF
jgi:phospholipase A-2-activating protein